MYHPVYATHIFFIAPTRIGVSRRHLHGALFNCKFSETHQTITSSALELSAICNLVYVGWCLTVGQQKVLIN